MPMEAHKYQLKTQNYLQSNQIMNWGLFGEENSEKIQVEQIFGTY